MQNYELISLYGLIQLDHVRSELGAQYKYSLLKAKVCSRGWLVSFWPAGSSTLACHCPSVPHSFLFTLPESVEDDSRFLSVRLG